MYLSAVCYHGCNSENKQQQQQQQDQQLLRCENNEEPFAYTVEHNTLLL